MKKINALPTENQLLIDFIKENFKMFNPQKDCKELLPGKAGNYVVLLKKETPLPMEGIVSVPVIRDIEFEGETYQLIYTGSTSVLQRRIGVNHFGDDTDAGLSTLRLSLGCLMGFTKIFRDRTENHLRFRSSDEQELTEWMHQNLHILYYENTNYKIDEKSIIFALNPPLNISRNRWKENAAFRSELSYLRKTKETLFEPIVERHSHEETSGSTPL